MRELKRWLNNWGLATLTRAAICALPGGSTGDKNNAVRPSQAAQHHQMEASQDEDSPGRLWENYIAAAEYRWPARLGHPQDSRARHAESGLASRACRARCASRALDRLADFFSSPLVVQNDIEEGTVHVDATVVVQES